MSLEIVLFLKQIEKISTILKVNSAYKEFLD